MALRVVEILDLIFNYLCPRESESEHSHETKVKMQTLAGAARACRLFYIPALSLLWRELDSIRPILSMVHGNQDDLATVSSPRLIVLSSL